VAAAIADRLPTADKLQEAVRRRRAVGGPAEKTFQNLVGLEMRPRRLRDAAALWAELERVRGVAGRDAVWEHPDLLPGPADLDDPTAFVSGSSISDAELEALASGAFPEAIGDGEAAGGGAEATGAEATQQEPGAIEGADAGDPAATPDAPAGDADDAGGPAGQAPEDPDARG
jgi:hypothetical protein